MVKSKEKGGRRLRLRETGNLGSNLASYQLCDPEQVLTLAVHQFSHLENGDKVLREGWYYEEIYVKHLEQCCQLINIEIIE